MSFEAPLNALVALAAVPAVAALVLAERRALRVAAALALRAPSRIAQAAPLAALTLITALLAAAAAEPVRATDRTLETRTDAEIAFVVDVTRSMGARERPDTPTRLARARAAALELRARFADVPAGLLSLTDRVLPHHFPTPRANVFAATVERALGVGRPRPARQAGAGRATSLDALQALETGGYFSPSAGRRVAIVLTDGESTPVTTGLAAPAGRAPIAFLFVHVWAPGERVFVRGRPEATYVSDPASRRTLEAIGPTFGEDELDEVAAGVRAALGDGPTRPAGSEERTVSLARYAVAAAALPLLLLLWSRNLWPGTRVFRRAFVSVSQRDGDGHRHRVRGVRRANA